MELSPENPLMAEPEIETAHADEFVEQLRCVTDTLPSRINIDAQGVEQGLAKLVLTLIEFIRRLLEKPEQIEELGLALMKLEGKLQELKTQFGLTDDDLNLDLGPIGRLI
jgi:CII-binding regulator of phage lambda lysogenization HflD